MTTVAITAALMAWSAATDARDADAVEALFHPAAVQHVSVGDTRMTLDTAAYAGLIRAGKVGGGETTVTVHEPITVRGDRATAHVTRETVGMVFEDAVVLQLVEGRWWIAGVVVTGVAKSGG